MSAPVRVGASGEIVVPHGHTSRRDGGKLSHSFDGSTPLISGAIKRTGETAAITTTNLLVAPAPGTWGVAVYVEMTTTTTPGTLTVTLGWTDAVGATTDASVAKAVTVADRMKGFVAPLEIASGNLTYAVAIGLFVGVYSIRLVPVRLA